MEVGQASENGSKQFLTTTYDIRIKEDNRSFLFVYFILNRTHTYTDSHKHSGAGRFKFFVCSLKQRNDNAV